MHLNFKVLLPVIIVISIIAFSFKAISQIKSPFSINELNYIYNRAFDIALRDKAVGGEIHPVFFNVNPSNYDSIIITVDPILSPKAFSTIYITELDSIPFNTSLNVQELFETITITNIDNIIKKSCGERPVLSGNHLMHVIFSDIYFYNDYYYIGVLIHHQLESGAIGYQAYTIIKFEYCFNKYILFCKLFVPLGFINNSKSAFYSREIEDKKCFHY